MPRKVPGEFVPSDINLSYDPAIMRAGAWAELIFRRANEFSKANRRDGMVLDIDLPLICRGVPSYAKHVQALVTCGLWEPEGDGWLIRSWRKWNMTEAEQAQARADKRKGGLMSRHRDGKHAERPSPDCPICNGEEAA